MTPFRLPSSPVVGRIMISLAVLLVLIGGSLAYTDGALFGGFGTTGARSLALGNSKLLILGSPREEYVRGAVLAFEAETGIPTTYVRMSAGEALEALRQGRTSPLYSVWWGGPIDQYIEAASSGLLESYEPRSYNLIPSKYKDRDRYWTGIYVGVLAIAVNTRELAERGLPRPTSWNDLTKPIYRGQISMAHPATSGTAYTTVATIMQLQGKDVQSGFAYLRLLDANVRSYEQAGDAPVLAAAKGDVPIAIAFSHDIVAAIEEGYQDLQVVFPSEGTGYEIGGVALVKDGPEPDAAKQFVDWATSGHAQELGARFAAYQIPTNPDAKVPLQSVRLASVNTIDYDFDWAAAHRDELVVRFTSTIAPVPK